MKSLIMTTISKHPDLFGDDVDAPTPIARELQAHFEAGGTEAEAVRLVAALERLALRSNRQQLSKRWVGKGSRLSEDWQPSAADVDFALERGLSRARLSAEAEKFRNYWTAKSGAGAVKRDWNATWRNWIIMTMERINGPSGTNPASRHKATGSAAVLAGVAAAADRRARERGAIGQHGPVTGRCGCFLDR
jgi:hypothetical protein